MDFQNLTKTKSHPNEHFDFKYNILKIAARFETAFLFLFSAIVGEGGNVGWECVDPCGGIKVLDGGEGGCVYASYSTVCMVCN